MNDPAIPRGKLACEENIYLDTMDIFFHVKYILHDKIENSQGM